MAVNLLAQALNAIKTHERAGKREVIVPYSKLIGEVLRVLKEEKYIEDYEKIEDGKGGKFRVKLANRINDIRSINPRMPVSYEQWNAIEAQYLPAVGVGIIIVTTPEGVMTNYEARRRKIGGILLAYAY